MTDTTVINPDQPYRMPDQQAVQDWRNSAPASPMAPQSPLSALGPPPAAPKPPQYPALNAPPMPQQPTQQQLGPAPDAKDYQKDSLAFASAMAVLGAVASRFTRVSGTAALSAFSGALNGWKQGNLQAYEDAAKKWEEDTKATLENNKQIMEQYKIALENRKMNIDEQMSQIQLIATKYHDQIMYDAAASKNYTMVANIYEKNAEYTFKAQQASDKLQEKREEQRQKNEQSAAYWLSPEGQTRFQQLQPAQQAAVKQLIDIYASKSAKGGEAGRLVQMENQEREARGQPPMTAKEEMQFIAQSKPARSAPAMALQKFLNEHPEATSEDIQAFQAQQAGKSSEERAVGQRAGAIAIAVDEARKTVSNVAAAAEKSAGKGLATWNAVENKWNVEKGDENFAYYVQQLNSLINVYGRVISGGGKGTVSDLEHARQMLNPNMPLSAVKGSLRGFSTEIDIAEKAPGDVRAKMHGGSSAADQSGTPKAGDVIKYDEQGNRVQ